MSTTECADPEGALSRKNGSFNIFTQKTTPVAADVILIEDSATSFSKKKATIGSLPAGGGEANTASNVGVAGVGVFKQKTGVDLEFKKVNAGSNKITITDDTQNSEVDVDIAESSIIHQNLSGAGTNTHSTIDGHISATGSVHGVSINGFEDKANKGAVSGYSPLDAAQKVPTINLGGSGADGTKYLRGDQTWATPAGGGESENIVRTTGDVSNSTTTFANVTGLTFVMLANEDYIFEAWLIFQSNTATVGIKFAVNGPASPTAVVIQTHIPISLVSVTQGAAVAYDSGTASASVAVINTSYLGRVTGIIRNGANAGTFAIRFAAETTGIVKVMTGSVLRYRKVV